MEYTKTERTERENLKSMERRELEEMPFDRLILWVDGDGIEREHWIHATGFEYLNSRGIWEAEFVFPDGSIG